jgi:hypothetical protein
VVLTRHTHSNYTSIAWLLVLAVQYHRTDSYVDKGYTCDIPQRSPKCFASHVLGSTVKEVKYGWIINVSFQQEAKTDPLIMGLQDGVRISNPARDVGVFQSSCCPTIAGVFCRVHRGSKKGQTKRIRDTYEARLISIASHSHGTP